MDKTEILLTVLLAAVIVLPAALAVCFFAQARKIKEYVMCNLLCQQYLSRCAKHTLFITKQQMVNIRDTNIKCENYEVVKTLDEKINDIEKLIKLL